MINAVFGKAGNFVDFLIHFVKAPFGFIGLNPYQYYLQFQQNYFWKG